MNKVTRLKILRLQSRLTQQEMSEKLGISQQHYAKIENDLARPKTEQCFALAKLFNVTVEFIFPARFGSENLEER